MNIYILLLCTVCVRVKAWVAIIKADPKTTHLGDCYTTSHNLGAFTAGEEKRIEGRCAVAVCSASGDISLRGCGVRRAAYPIRVLPGDLSKPYPRCCHRIVGPNNDTDSDNERPRNTGNVVLAGAFLNPMLSR